MDLHINDHNWDVGYGTDNFHVEGYGDYHGNTGFGVDTHTPLNDTTTFDTHYHHDPYETRADIGVTLNLGDTKHAVITKIQLPDNIHIRDKIQNHTTKIEKASHDAIKNCIGVGGVGAIVGSAVGGVPGAIIGAGEGCAVGIIKSGIKHIDHDFLDW